MPSRPERPCAHPGCTAVGSGVRCATHSQRRRADLQRNYSGASEFKYDRHWRRLRADFLSLEANALCVVCGIHATEADHIIPHRGSAALGYDANNLQGMCNSCHGKKTAREVLTNR